MDINEKGQNPLENMHITFREKLNMDVLTQYNLLFKQALNEKKPIILQANEIKQINTVVLQLILNFILTIKLKGITWHWQDPSPELIHAAHMLGMKGLLELPDA